MRRLLLCFALFVALAAPTAFAQETACTGVVTRVRLSAVKKGKMEQFKLAVAANLAWYRSKGVTTNNIVMAPVMDYSSSEKIYKISSNEAMVFHSNPPQVSGIPLDQDDGYRAFVKMYSDSSTVEQEFTICMPAKQ